MGGTRTLHYNCVAGLSGDMNLGLMVDLGVKLSDLERELAKLGLGGWRLAAERDERSGITGTRVTVLLDDQAHDGAGEGSKAHGDSHRHSHGEGEHAQRHHHHHHHHHGEDHHSHDHHHGHEHRAYRDIKAMIEKSGLSEKVKQRAVDIFNRIAVAEGKVHGKEPLEVHFHEVGAVDSIVDVVGAAICWELLGVDRITCGPVELGGGFVDCAHGRMPVPAPATALILEGMAVTSGATSKEATTPSGAAILASGSGGKTAGLERGRIEKSGYGIGQRRDPNLPNVVQGVLLMAEQRGNDDGYDRDEVFELAANLDDMTPEAVAHLSEALMQAEALDVWQSPATFKKGRLGCVLHLLCRAKEKAALIDLLFERSSTLGVREQLWQRYKLERRHREVDTTMGKVRVKQAWRGGKLWREKIEAEDCGRIAQQRGLSLDAARNALAEEIKGSREGRKPNES